MLSQKAYTVKWPANLLPEYVQGIWMFASTNSAGESLYHYSSASQVTYEETLEEPTDKCSELKMV